MLCGKLNFSLFHCWSLSWPPLCTLAGIQTQMRVLIWQHHCSCSRPLLSVVHQLTAAFILEFVEYFRITLIRISSISPAGQCETVAGMLSCGCNSDHHAVAPLLAKVLKPFLQTMAGFSLA